MKKLLATLLLGAALAVAALPVSAQGTDGTVTLTADGNAAAVSLALPQEAAQGVTALRLSFEVESSEPVEAEFVFDAELPGTVQQYRYDAASGRLNVYVAGREDLLPDGDAALGEVRVKSSQATTATVRVVQDSLELVDAALAKSEATTSSNGEVSLTLDGNGGTTPQPSEKPSGGGNSNQGSSSNQTTQSSPAPTTVTSTAPTPTAAPTTAGQQPTAQSGSGSKKPTGSKATPAPSATPEPDEETQATATPAPTASPEAATQTATPEQAQPEQAAATGLPMAVIVVIACLAAAVLIGVLVIRFRNR